METAAVHGPAKMPRGRYKVTPTLASVRSAISNGSTIIAEADHRSAPMRRLRDLMAAMTSDLGGPANVSEAERLLIRRAAVMALQCEMLEQRWAANDHEASATQLDLYTRTSGNMRRVLETLGIGLPRRMVDVTPPVPAATPSFVRDLLDHRHDPAAFRAALHALDRHARVAARIHLLPLLYPDLVQRLAEQGQPAINLNGDVDLALYDEVQGVHDDYRIDDPFGLFERDDETGAPRSLLCGGHRARG